MAKSSNLRSGGQVLVDALLIHGVDTAFCVAGESYLALLDALYDVSDRIRLITCRHENGAAYMAESFGKLTGRPGICMVTRGPGACNASIGVHSAMQASSPMVMFVGQVPRAFVGRDALQEVDISRMFAPLAKWTVSVDAPGRIPEIVSRAFHVAVSGRPGPVVVALPEDMLAERCEANDTGPYHVVQPTPGAAEMHMLRELLAGAERPVMLVGGADWDEAACTKIVAFAEINNLPTFCAFRRQDVFDNRHLNYAGEIGFGPRQFVERLREADLVIAVGSRLGEIVTDAYRTLVVPTPRQTLVHVHSDAAELGRVYRPKLAIQASNGAFAEVAAAFAPVDHAKWKQWAESAHQDYLRSLVPPAYEGNLDLGAVMVWLRDNLPADAIIVGDAGVNTVWHRRFLSYSRPGRVLGPNSAAMGYAIPTTIMAKLRHPERCVIGFTGDGSFVMASADLATAVRYRTAAIFIVLNDGRFTSIRVDQEKNYPGRVSGTELTNPDFTGLARAYGAHGETVETTAAFPAAFAGATAANGPAVIELRMDPDVVGPNVTLSGIHAAAVARQSGPG